MKTRRNKLYGLIVFLCTAGYFRILLEFGLLETGRTNKMGFCLIKQITDIPCPSCGVTRSIVAIMEGSIAQSVLINPFGLFLFILMLILPIWIGVDLLMSRASFHDVFKKSEILLRKSYIAFPLIALVLVNWAWNISKGL